MANDLDFGPGYSFDLGKEKDILSRLGQELAEQGKVNITPLSQWSFDDRPSAMGLYTRQQIPPDSREAKILEKYGDIRPLTLLANEEELLVSELARLNTILVMLESKEEYRKAAIVLKKIKRIEKRLNDDT